LATLDTFENVRFEPAGKRHARELSRIMRASDRAEIFSSGGFKDAGVATRLSINRSTEAWAAYVGDHLLCVFGVTVLKDLDVVWALTSDHVDQHPLSYWRASKYVVEYLRNKYALMVNMIHCGYPQAVRWASRLGFKVAPPEPFGTKNELFVRVMLATPRLIEEVRCV
jgi:hypothetical protein